MRFGPDDGQPAPLSFCGQPSLLAALLEQGIDVAHDCRNGTCGACRVRVLAGEVRQVVPPELPLPADCVLACCVVPATALDLCPS